MTRFFKVLFIIYSLCLSANLSAQREAFITTWKTDNPGISDDASITIPTHPSHTYNYEVDWDNDGIYEQTSITGSITHDFLEKRHLHYSD